MEGCSRYCSFCVVPYTRGEEMSRPFDQVVAEVASLAAQGVREITLLGQNVNAYRGPAADGDASDLAGAHPPRRPHRRPRAHPLHDLASARVLASRWSMPMPRCRSSRTTCTCRCRAARTASSRCMKRGYTRLEYKQKIRRLRAARPDISLSSDFIVGFPGETEADFQQTLDLIADVGFDQSFSFIYSRRPGHARGRAAGRGAARGQAAAPRDACRRSSTRQARQHQRGDDRQHPARAGREALAPRPAPARRPHGEHALGELRRAAARSSTASRTSASPRPCRIPCAAGCVA